MVTISTVVMVSHVCTRVNIYQIVYFKCVWFNVCQLYLKKAIK